MKSIKYIFISALLLGFTSCNDDPIDPFEEDPAAPLPALTSGSADFSNYVALGNSLTAGFTDNALFISGQQNSFPNLIAQKFALVGGGAFTQPLTNDNIGGLLFGGTPIFDPRLYAFIDPVSDEDSCPYPDPDKTGPSVLGVSPEDNESVPASPSTDITNNPNGPFNNLGVPGAKSFHLLAPGYGNPAGVFAGTANPYFVRMASNPSTSVIADAVVQNPTFFSLWIGNNDVLGYALSGGDGTNPITPIDGPPGVGFNQTYGALIAALTAGGSQGVVANIPDVTSIPHFTTVPFDALDPCNPLIAPQIDALNAQLYGPLSNIFTALGEPDRIKLLSSTENNPVLINDENATDRTAQIAGALTPVLGAPTANAFGAIFGKARQATATDLFVLPSSTAIGSITNSAPAPINVRGISFPLEDKWVLLPSEQAEIAEATIAFNDFIQSAANQAGLAFLDANSVLSQVSSGSLESGDFNLTSSLVTGGAFSLDGVHPTARGYALIANEVMKAIDATYGSNFEASGNLLDIGDYPTNFSPMLQ